MHSTTGSSGCRYPAPVNYYYLSMHYSFKQGFMDSVQEFEVSHLLKLQTCHPQHAVIGIQRVQRPRSAPLLRISTYIKTSTSQIHRQASRQGAQSVPHNATASISGISIREKEEEINNTSYKHIKIRKRIGKSQQYGPVGSSEKGRSPVERGTACAPCLLNPGFKPANTCAAHLLVREREARK